MTAETILLRRVSTYLLLLLALAVLAPAAQATMEPQQLLLLPGAEDPAPSLRLLAESSERLQLEFTLPSLQFEDVDIEGQRFQALAAARFSSAVIQQPHARRDSDRAARRRGRSGAPGARRG